MWLAGVRAPASRACAPRWLSSLWPGAAGRPREQWTQTAPGKSWFLFLRLYGPLEPWFDKTWRPGEIERVD